MSLNIWYSTEPCEPKYLQISHEALSRYAKKTKKDFDAFRTHIHNHHAQPATKDGMFVLESFFGGEVFDLVADYLKSEGYTVKEDYKDLEGECIIEGYDGILVNWSW
ncbi:hypothetical protein [Klebsiella phage phiKp_21]|uniref:Uncharacterized protein n=1 Tax=Klebsiella phage vB_KleM_RaK2 TaxID=1147094 RepID=H6X432_9CAUD|nr:hypothetical protein F403_gp310 [Klebsiella phage vB_KleM_RaK2]AFA44498.1 hypothetical protein RaK2_00225 [Klebsiella phage vB_KleM_RaK2]BEH88446.1 hypothetical protein [Klebsiella phage phiKp_21]